MKSVGLTLPERSKGNNVLSEPAEKELLIIANIKNICIVNDFTNNPKKIIL